MKEQTKTKIRGLVGAVVVLAVTAIFLTIGYIGSNAQVNTLSTQLENNYQRSVYELMTDLNNIETDLSKALVSTSISAKQKLYDKIYTECTQASEDLSRLPINHESVNQTTSFINQMGGFSYYLSNKTKNGEDLSTEDYNSVDKLHTTCLYIQSILNNFSSDYNGKYSILANTKDVSDNSNSFNTMFSSMQAEGVDYPTLIYDGPFSQSQAKKEIKGLTGEEVSNEQAKKKLEDVYKDDGVISLNYEGESTGVFSTYNFSIKLSSGREIYAQVTKKGGFLLSINSFASSDSDKLDLATCEQKAEDFASKLGLNLKAVWSTKIAGMAYINLTPIVDDVIIYPDMIKVKVSCKTGEVLGFEAQSYAYNHTERSELTAQISENNARSKVSSNLTIETQKLTLIPIEYGNETLCYEYKCSLNKQTYYVYINAKTGEEEQILKVIETTDGSLLM